MTYKVTDCGNCHTVEGCNPPGEDVCNDCTEYDTDDRIPVDPALTIGVALYIAYEAWPIINQTIKILMQSSPDLDYDSIENDLKQIDGVTAVHHVHAWMMDEHRIIFSAHLNCDDLPLSQVERIYSQVEKILHEKYGICHVTIQAEYHRGKDEELFNTPVDEKNVISNDFKQD